MSYLPPMFASDTKAAQLLDLKPTEFRSLVNEGHLPPGKDICGFVRWDVEELRRIIRGDAVEEEMKW